MGITIHFEGQLRSERAYSDLLVEVRDFAADRDWPCEQFVNRQVTLMRVRDEQDWEYNGSSKGLELMPHPNCEPLRFEFDADLFIQQYIKTQFAPVEVHKDVATLLRLLSRHFTTLRVEDEGEYYDSQDEDTLIQTFQQCFEMIDGARATDATLHGPIRLPSGRIADLVRGS